MQTIRALIYREGEYWIAQCLEHDICAQARTEVATASADHQGAVEGSPIDPRNRCAMASAATATTQGSRKQSRIHVQARLTTGSDPRNLVSGDTVRPWASP